MRLAWLYDMAEMVWLWCGACEAGAGFQGLGLGPRGVCGF